MSSATDEFDELLNDGNDDYLLALSLQTLEDELDSNEEKIKNQKIKSDYELALRLSQLDDDQNEDIEDKNSVNNLSIVSPQLELSDPSPDIWLLMKQFDSRFFAGVLAKHCIELSWSPRMTRTAGLCAWNPKTNYCSIRLSLPLLQLRSRKDLVETLIHEMIHALLFVTKTDDNHESHGPIFHEHMHRINKESGTNITVYHNFHAEVNHYLKHVWRCEGICREKAPYFGYVRRSMNRKPGPHDYWFKYHQSTCGGTFTKISEPENNKVATNQKLNSKDIRDFISPNKNKVVQSAKSVSQIVPFSGLGHKLGSDKSINNPKNFKRKQVPTPEKLNNHDIRNFFSPKSSQVIEATNKPLNKSKVLPFSGFEPESISYKSNNNSNNKEPSVKPILQIDSLKRVDTNNSYDSELTKSKKARKVSSFSSTITNDSNKGINSMSNSSANVRTISSFSSSEQTIMTKQKAISATFTPFCGKGNVLGTIKSDNHFIKPNEGLAQNNKSVNLKSSTFNINGIKENIEIIQLD